MRSRELQQILATLTGRVIGDIDTRTRVLRHMNEIGSGPRGPAAPHMNSAEWAMHLTSLVSRRVPEAGEVAGRLHKECHLKTMVPDLLGEKLPSVTTLLAFAIEHGPAWLGNVEITEDGNFAWANVHSGGRVVDRLFFTTDPAIDGDQADWTSIGSRMIIGGVVLQMLHKQFAQDASARAPVSGEAA